jgi:hypothetical protein
VRPLRLRHGDGLAPERGPTTRALGYQRGYTPESVIFTGTDVVVQGLIGSRALGLYHPLVRHRPSHDIESFLWIFLQMIIQYFPSVVISNRVFDDGTAFKDARRAALVGFDDATPLDHSFAAKQDLLSSQKISGSVGSVGVDDSSTNRLGSAVVSTPFMK